MERTQAMLQVIRIQYIASQDEPHYWGWHPLLLSFGDLSETELARNFATTEALRGHPDLRRFFDWVGKRPPGWTGKVR